MKLSSTLQTLLEDYQDQPLAIGTLLERTGAEGFGILSGLLTVPMLIPLPIPLPGLSALMGIGTLLLGGQLAMGATQPWLPKKFTQVELSPEFSRGLLKNLNRALRPVEKFACTRYVRVSHNLGLRRFLGFCMAWNALLMSLPLPIPLTNLLPAYSIETLVIGLLEADGILMLIGFAMTAITTVFFVSIAGTIWLLLIEVLKQLNF
ncbi:MAG: exopolysaccharide biosynthesis protein [Synechococcales bacterium]|nr:exopolysaccharide biosynthesis protein [Synechococcales bacterium]